MSVNRRTLIRGDSKSDLSLELDELPPLWEFEQVLSWELESGCFGAWNNSSIANSGLTESSHFQATDSSKITSLDRSNWSFLGLKSRKPFDSSL
jgi:hypothetical protein